MSQTRFSIIYIRPWFGINLHYSFSIRIYQPNSKFIEFPVSLSIRSNRIETHSFETFNPNWRGNTMLGKQSVVSNDGMELVVSPAIVTWSCGACVRALPTSIATLIKTNAKNNGFFVVFSVSCCHTILCGRGTWTRRIDLDLWLKNEIPIIFNDSKLPEDNRRCPGKKCRHVTKRFFFLLESIPFRCFISTRIGPSASCVRYIMVIESTTFGGGHIRSNNCVVRRKRWETW